MNLCNTKPPTPNTVAFLVLYIIIELVDSISRDEPDSPLTQYITNAGISRARYTITHFKHHIILTCCSARCTRLPNSILLVHIQYNRIAGELDEQIIW